MAMRQQQPLQMPQQWKALGHPLRVRALQLLAGRAMTNEELAVALGVASGKLYFHTRTLREAGLIELVETRQKGGVTEKLYRAAARAFLAPPPVKGGQAPPLEPYLQAALELYRRTWQGTGGLPDALEYGFHLVLPHQPERVREFVRRVRELFDDFQAGPSDATEAQTVALSVLLHALPAHRPENGGENDR